jgi:hypothetical protein
MGGGTTFGIEGHWQLIDSWRGFGFEVRQARDIEIWANVESTTLAGKRVNASNLDQRFRASLLCVLPSAW